MATTTPNFGWPVPTSTDLVKDGATAMEALGDAIDTSMVDLKGGTTGQVLAKASNTDMDFSWTSPNPGDITAVTAGTGISGGGTSGDVTITNSMATAIDAKGDLIAGTGADAFSRLAVGNNGDGLVADSSTSTGLRYQSTYNGNAIINGAMDIWQRGTTFTNPTVANYTADRYMINRTGDAAGSIVSRTTSAPTGFQYAMQWQRTAGNTSTAAPNLYYGLESADSYRFAGQTATLSFYAKKGANYSGGDLSVAIGSGTATDAKPYASTTTVATTNVTLTTTYQRFTLTGTFGSSITQAFFNMNWSPSGTAGADDSVYLTGIQLELGSVPTTFKRSGNTIAGELVNCQRYYWRSTGGAAYSVFGGNCSAWSTVDLLGGFNLPVTMRTNPTSVEYSTLIASDGVNNNSIGTLTFSSAYSSPNVGGFSATSTSLTAFRFYRIQANNSTSAYIAYSAEL